VPFSHWKNVLHIFISIQSFKLFILAELKMFIAGEMQANRTFPKYATIANALDTYVYVVIR